MNQKRIKKIGAALLICVMLIGLLPAVAAEEVPFGISFADPYSKVGQPMHVEVTGATGAVS